jgi:hypothetical protein
MNRNAQSAVLPGPAPYPAWRWRDTARPAPPPDRQPPLPLPAPATGAGPDDDGLLAVARPWAHAIVETLNGRRGVHQLIDAFDISQLRQLSRITQICRPSGAHLAGLRAQAPRDGVVEVTLTLATPPWFRAAALRLVRESGRWRCADLTFG